MGRRELVEGKGEFAALTVMRDSIPGQGYREHARTGLHIHAAISEDSTYDRIH